MLYDIVDDNGTEDGNTVARIIKINGKPMTNLEIDLALGRNLEVERLDSSERENIPKGKYIITNKVMAKPQLPFGVINFSLIRKKFQRELQEQGIMEYRIYRPVLPGDGKTFVLGSITLHLGPDYNGFEKILKEEGAIP